MSKVIDHKCQRYYEPVGGWKVSSAKGKLYMVTFECQFKNCQLSQTRPVRG